MLLELEPTNQNLSHKDRAKLNKVHERELSRLQNNLRKVCKPPSLDYITRLQNSTVHRIIQNLEHDKDDIDLNLNVALGVTHVNDYEAQLKQIRDQIEYQHDLEMEIKDTGLEIIHLESQLKRLDKEEGQLLKISPNEREHAENCRKSCLNLEIVERNRNLSRLKEGKMIAENSQLKSIIASMLHDRNLINKTWHRMITQLYENRRFLVDMIERAILAFNQSEDLVHKIRNTKTKSKQDEAIHLRDMTQMRRQLDIDGHYHEFLAAKGFYREMGPLEEREVRRRQMVERDLKKDLKLYHTVIDKVLEKFEPDKETCKGDSLLKRPGLENVSIKTVSKVDTLKNLRDILSEYIRSEKSFFSRFNYFQILNHSCEYLSQLMFDVEKNLSKMKDTSEKLKIQTSENVKEVYDALTQAKSKTSDIHKAWETNESYLNSILTGIQEICNVVGCDTRYMKNLLGNHTKVSLFNIKLFLYSLEKQVNSILAHIYYTQQHSDTPAMINLTQERPSLVDVTKIVTQQQCSECAEQTDVKMYDDTIVRPMSRETVRKLIKENVFETDMQYRLHTLSQCRLPRSRILVNKRYT